MRELSLKDFGMPKGQNYHVYLIGGSEISQQPHSHDYYQLCYVVCGQIWHWQNDTPVTLCAGDAFLVPPGFVHSVVFPDSGSRMYSLSFSEDLFHPGFSSSNVYRFMTALKLETMEDRLDVRMKVPLNQTQRGNLQALLDCLIAESQTQGADELSAAPSLIAAAMCVVGQGYFAQPERQEQLRRVERCQRAMEDCVAYIDTHYTQELTLNQLAHDFAISRSQFSLLFPQYTGSTLKRYVAKKRIDHAVMLLQTTTMPVHQIAAAVGYEDLTTFYRNFTKISGVQPMAYRSEK